LVRKLARHLELAGFLGRGKPLALLAGRRRDEVAQSLQGRAQQGGAAIPVVEEHVLLRQEATILLDASAQSGDLALDRLLLDLLIRGDAGINSDLHFGAFHAMALRGRG